MSCIIKNQPTTCIPKSVFSHDFTWGHKWNAHHSLKWHKAEKGLHINWMTKSRPENKSLEWDEQNHLKTKSLINIKYN